MSCLPSAYRVSLCFLPVLALSGCDILGGRGGDDSGGECPYSVTELQDDTEIAPVLGFAAADVLSWTTGDRTASARWSSPRSGISTNAPESDTQLSMTLTRAEGPAAEATCELVRLQVPVDASISTADGLFAVEHRGLLAAHRADFAHVQVAFDFEDLDGTFEWQSEQQGVELVRPTVSLVLTPEGISGGFGAIHQITTDDAVIDPGGGTPLLQWPAQSPCSIDQVGVPLLGAEPFWRNAIDTANKAT